MAEARKKIKFWQGRLWWLATTVLAVFIAMSAGREWYAHYLFNKEIKILESESGKMEARRLELLRMARQLEQGDFIEKQARLEFGLRQAGETVVVVPEGAIANTKNPPSRERSNPWLWWDYFTRRDKSI